MCMHWFRGELLRSPMALKILRKGDVIRLKQATSLHSILICLVPHIDCARNPTFQNWGVTVQRKFLREHSCASPDTLIVLLAFVFAHRWNMWRQKNRSCPWSNTLSSSTCSARFRHNPWKLLAKKCAGNNTSTKTFLVFFSRPLTSGISCRYYNLTALVICFFSPPAGWQTLVHAPGIHQWRRIVLVTIDRFESWLKTQFIVLGADLNATWSKRLWSCSFPVRHDGALNVIKSGWYLHSNRPECSILSKPSLQTSQVLEKGKVAFPMNTFDSTLGKPGCWTCTSWSYYKSKDRDRLVSCMVCHDRSTWRTLQSGSNQRIVTVTLLSLPYHHPQINIWFSSWSRQQVVTVELLSSNYDPSYLNEIISGGGLPSKIIFWK